MDNRKQLENYICQKLRNIFNLKLLFIAVIGLIVTLVYTVSNHTVMIYSKLLISEILVCFFIVIVYLICTLRGQALEQDVRYKYAKGGSCYLWYDKTYRYNKKINWLEKVDQLLKDNHIFLDKPLTLLSPSGCKGKYEKELAAKNKNIQCIVTDIHIPENHEIGENNYLYLAKSHNALEAAAYLKEIHIHEVDVIWDMKGALWYLSKNQQECIELLTVYHQILSKDGVVIIDAYHYNKVKEVFAPILESGNWIPFYGEKSTYQKLNEDTNTELNRLFDVRLLGNGKEKIAILRKKRI